MFANDLEVAMHDAESYPSAWSAAAHLEREALQEWRKEHYPQERLDDAIAIHLTQLLTTLEQKRGGNISVTVSLLDRAAFRSKVSYFRLQRLGKKVVRQEFEPSRTA